MSTIEFSLVMTVWLVWLTFWIASSGNAKAVVKRESQLSRRLQSIPLVLGGMLVLCPDLGVPAVDTHYVLAAHFATECLAFVLLISGLLLAVHARVVLAGNWSVSVTLKADHALISAGPYAWVRHPIYSGVLLATLGSALVGGQYRGLVGIALIAASLAYKVKLEERWLTDRFGGSYCAYQAQVAALMPLIY